MLKGFWVGLCVAILTLVATIVLAERRPGNFVQGVPGGGDSLKYEDGRNGTTIVSTFVDTNDARNIDSLFSGYIPTDLIDEDGFTMWFEWDSIPGDTSYPGDSIGVYLYTSYRNSDWRNPDDSITKIVTGDTLARFGYIFWKYPSDSINDTLFYYQSWLEVDVWDSTSDSVNVNTEHKYKFKCDYSY